MSPLQEVTTVTGDPFYYEISTIFANLIVVWSCASRADSLLDSMIYILDKFLSLLGTDICVEFVGTSFLYVWMISLRQYLMEVLTSRMSIVDF